MFKITKNLFIIFSILFFFVSLVLAFTIVLILINQHVLIDQKNVNVFDTFIKASFTLIGSSLSGFVAIFIFILQQVAVGKSSRKLQKDYIEKIKQEISLNIDIIKPLSKIFEEATYEEISRIISDENNSLKEKFLIYYSKIDLSLIKKLVDQLSSVDYSIYNKMYSSLNKISKYLSMIIDTKHKDNIEILLESLNTEIQNALNFDLK